MSIDEIRESSPDFMTDDQMREFLTEEGVGVLGLLDEGVPYLVPMSFGFDGDSTLYFVFLLFGTESRKETLSDRAGQARFLVYDAESANEWRSLSLTGPLREIEDDEWTDLRDAMENAWHPDVFSAADPMRGIEGYRLEIDEWTGIQHGS
ncbi:pyridoxamine 5'-phosphate oxidase family protein [Halorarum halophilum]|uniref:Pyridoxamine 5'-phosphate oxidase family protein n=1 Tax=Halorarum halophilum TaxID=2743090 RepID=A0A7D5GD56_9EURY|nr:pyridoxamine 5'-phosphate oxidase family protein [Halobaculum halophilum]QLG28752.1 pyridoxamine 5'-phosphate oxidase family protein [Halobaculum halophilum]